MTKLIITTSRNPSDSLLKFVKSLVKTFPNALKINRGLKFFSSLLSTCLIYRATDFILVYEKRGKPLSMILTHLPLGPSVFFGLSELVQRNNLEINFSQSDAPHVLFLNLNSPIGKRIAKIISTIFESPAKTSQRLITFIGENNSIIFHHHYFQKKGSLKKDLYLKKLSPGFRMHPYKILLGDIFSKKKETEWIITPFLNRKKKNAFLY
jgi:U3 small nucleolar ribonucleoprotein protein IMP4